MRSVFRRQVRQALAEQQRFDAGPLERLGCESETALVGDRAQAVHDLLLQEGLAGFELGALQVETRTEPEALKGGSADALIQALALVHRPVADEAAKAGVQVLRAGFNPFHQVIDAPRHVAEERYVSVPEFHNRHRRPASGHQFGLLQADNGRGRMSVADAAAIGLGQSIHPNVQCGSLSQAIRLMNRSFGISPWLLALAGSSRFLMGRDGKILDTGYNDGRAEVWALSHDTRTPQECEQGLGLRVGLPEGYFPNAAAYFQRMLRFRFILWRPKHALQFGVGLSWLDARVKLLEDRALVELRTIPTQPRVEDEIALALLWIGRLAWAETHFEPLPEFGKVRMNRRTAETLGLRGSYWVAESGRSEQLPASQALQIELSRSLEGLRSLEIAGAEELCTDFFWQRLSLGSPSDQLSRRIGGKTVADVAEIREALVSLGMLQ